MKKFITLEAQNSGTKLFSASSIIPAVTLLFFFLQVTAYAETSRFDGWHLGVGVGGTQEVLDSKKMLDPDIGGLLIVTETLKDKDATTGPEAHLIAGYGKVIHQKYLLGLEGRIGFQHLKAKSINSTEAIVGGTLSTRFGMNTTIKASDVSGALLFKPGFVISPQTMFYGLIGSKVERFKISSEDNYMQALGPQVANSVVSGSKSVTKFGLVLGLGMETYITDKTTLGLDYHYVNYGKLPNFNLSAPFDGPGGTLSVTNQTKLFSNSILLRINYYY